jgi:CRISPR-associated protein Cas5h
MQKLISFDIESDFGFLKKPDTNEPIYITYNMLHKPALLGILGAIIGLSGFKIILETGRRKKRTYIPEYYDKLKDLKVGIQPLNAENGNFMKTVIRYNNSVGYANKDGGTLIIDEQTLIKPSYRCFLLLDSDQILHEKLYQNLKKTEAEYLPYLGKNDFTIWWNHFNDDYPVKQFDFSHNFKVASVIKKSETLGKAIVQSMGRAARSQTQQEFTFFERLPVAYRTDLMQYELADFALTNATLDQNFVLDGLFQIYPNETIHLF